MTPPHISIDGDQVSIESDDGTATMPVGSAQLVAQRLLEWLGDPDDDDEDVDDDVDDED